MFRLWLIISFVLGASGACLAQPPVAMVGVSEEICVTDSHQDASGSCPVVPQDRQATGQAEEMGVARPKGFEVAYTVVARDDERGEGYYIFGEVAGSSNAPYLAFAPLHGLPVPVSWEFFTGRGLSGSVNWVGFDRWQRHTGADGLWNPGEKAKVFSPDKICGGFQVEWNAPLGRWLMLYGCGSETWVRVAQNPSGPWSEPSLIANAPEGSGPVLLHTLDAIGPAEAGSRSTMIYWSLGHNGRSHVMRAVLRQDGAQ